MNILPPNHNGTGLRIGIVQARFTNPIGTQLVKSCTERLQKLGVSANDITLATVPGALEIPLILQSMARSRQYDALVAIGVVIRGETYHFELVANEAAAGVSRISLQEHIPIANAILTTENDAQAIARMFNKGSEAAVVAVEMANLLKTQNQLA
ncbi:6,7-dimethyl-8-ribityllumazine synthase [Snodgrassella sp. B3882]|uniref:6,7-dimethyl-8-ribityllumazine synthase n=1 Tax=Snodgrassella sp. B3882 TaxID=2818037 RepID=UPI00226AB94B|nr:6,7-dimethyl-8-ribityllumazine synthase [Snodgrassella sp. B3882]MCX8744480.1 6,7-dimethyl-8-ribityllumazine synthase [Snodgrassella sp. B3882]